MYSKYEISRITDNHFKVEKVGIKNNLSFAHKNVSIYPSNYINHCEKILKNLNFNRHQNFIIFGVRNSILIEEIYERMSSYSTLTIIEVESFDEPMTLIGTDLMRDMFANPRCKLLFGTPSFIIKELSNVVYDVLFNYNMRNLEIITVPYHKKLFPKQTEDIIEALFEKLRAYASAYGNSVEDILWGVDNFFNNWDIFCSGVFVDKFDQAMKGVPALIVGAGPSLDRCITQLKEIQDYVLIFAVDAAVGSLRKNGIRIDAVSTIERTIVPIRFYQDIESFNDEIFIGPNVIKKEILNKFNKWIFSGRKGDGFFREITKYLGHENIDVGLTVANVPFAYAQKMGCDPIVFVGVDLAYEDGVTHTSDIMSKMTEEIRDDYVSNMTRVRGISGVMLDTYEYFVHTKVWFERAIAANPGTRYINTTDFGADIAGTEQLSFNEFVNELEFQQIDKRILNSYAEVIDEKANKIEQTEKGIEFVNEIILHLEGFQDVLAEVRGALLSEESNKLITIINNRTKIDSALYGCIPLRFMFQPIFIAHYRVVHAYPILIDDKAQKELIELSLQYYETLVNVAESIRESMDAYNELLGIYLNEYSRKGGATYDLL